MKHTLSKKREREKELSIAFLPKRLTFAEPSEKFPFEGSIQLDFLTEPHVIDLNVKKVALLYFIRNIINQITDL